MKIRCRTCDICGVKLWDMNFQWWIKSRVRRGYPALGMKNYDVCETCFAELQVMLKEKAKMNERPED